MTHQQAHDALADVIYWLKGFRAGCDLESPAMAETTFLIEQAQSVQDFISTTRPEEKESA